MGSPGQPSAERGRRRRRAGAALAALLLAGLVAFALSQLGLPRIWHALITASPGWIAVALVLMGLSLFMRSLSWHQTLRAALPTTHIAWAAVVRATMIGVMASAVFPGRIGEPTRVVVLARRLEGPNRRLLPVVAGTVFSQTLINLPALVLLAVNVSAILPPTPSNLGVFQAACLVVLAAYGVGAGSALAYGIILQAVEVLTALALGTPALLREGLTWRDIRSAEAAGGTAATEVLPP